MWRDHQSVLKKSDFLKEVVFQLGPAVGAEGKEEDLNRCFVWEAPQTSRLGLGTPVLRSHPPSPSFLAGGTRTIVD